MAVLLTDAFEAPIYVCKGADKAAIWKASGSVWLRDYDTPTTGGTQLVTSGDFTSNGLADVSGSVPVTVVSSITPQPYIPEAGD